MSAPSPTSPSNPYKVLSKDSDFPQIARKQLADILQEMLVKKELFCEIYQTGNRKDKERYRSARTAPTSEILVCADEQIEPPCSAPSTTGGMGETESTETILS